MRPMNSYIVILPNHQKIFTTSCTEGEKNLIWSTRISEVTCEKCLQSIDIEVIE